MNPAAIEFDFLERFKEIKPSNVFESLGDLISQSGGHLWAFLLGMVIVSTVISMVLFALAYRVVKKKRSSLKFKVKVL